MAITRQQVDRDRFNPDFVYPFSLRQVDFESAMQDIYDFFFDINSNMLAKGLRRLEDIARPQLLSGLLSDLLTDALGSHARSLVVNQAHNGHPDLLVGGRFRDDEAPNGGADAGVEIKSTSKPGGAVDTHGARNQWMCVFVYQADTETEPQSERAPTKFTEVYLAQVGEDDFRSNRRATNIGTRTATLHRQGLSVLRAGKVYFDRG